MKKKLRLYCGVLAVVLVAAIVCDLVHVNYSSSTDKEREERELEEQAEEAHIMRMQRLRYLRRHIEEDFK